MKGVLLGDVSGTHTRLAITYDGETLNKCEWFETNSIEDFSQFINNYLQSNEILYAVFACAGKINSSVVKLTNQKLKIDVADIKQNTCLENIVLLHDFHAIALGQERVSNYDNICEFRKGKQLIIGAGTGLGVGIYDGEYENTEGGHEEVFIEDEALRNFLKNKKEKIEWEDIVSGRGLEKIYEFISGTYESVGNFAKRVDDLNVKKTFSLFYEWYAKAIEHFSQKYLCSQVIVSGGVIVHSYNFLDKDQWENIISKDRGVKIILDYDVSLYGLLEYVQKMK